MVKPSRILMLMLTLLMASSAVAQYYSATDTTYLYPNYGTFYHDRFQGRKTTSGEVFDQNLFTAAHWKLPFGTLVLVTNHNTNREIIVKINDRCPKRGVLDMTHRAATALGIRGCQKVVLRVIPSTEYYIQRWQAQLQQYDTVAVKSSSGSARTPSPKSQTSSSKGQTSPSAATDVAPLRTIVLGTATSHSQAFNLIQHLPERYREAVIITPMPDEAHLQISLSSQLSEAEAQRALRELSHIFPQAKLL